MGYYSNLYWACRSSIKEYLNACLELFLTTTKYCVRQLKTKLYKLKNVLPINFQTKNIDSDTIYLTCEPNPP